MAAGKLLRGDWHMENGTCGLKLPALKEGDIFLADFVGQDGEENGKIKMA